MPKNVNNITVESGGEMAVYLSLNGVSCWVKRNKQRHKENKSEITKICYSPKNVTS